MDTNPYASPTSSELNGGRLTKRPWGVWVVAFLYVVPATLLVLLVAAIISLWPAEGGYLLKRGAVWLVVLAVGLSLSILAGIGLFLRCKWGWYLCQFHCAMNVLAVLDMWFRHNLAPELGQVVVSGLYTVAAASLLLPRPRNWIGLSRRGAVYALLVVIVAAAALHYALGWIGAIVMVALEG